MPSMLADRPILVKSSIINQTFITFELLSLEKFFFGFIGHHTGSKFYGTDRNGPNYRIELNCAGRAKLQYLFCISVSVGARAA